MALAHQRKLEYQIASGIISIQDSSQTYNFPVPLVFNEGTVVAIVATSDKAATITGSWFGWLEDA